MSQLVKCDCCGKSYVYESSPMIKDSLWKRISNEHWKGNKWISEKFCLECMEAKLGRKITANDFGRYRNYPYNLEFLRLSRKRIK